MVMEFIATKMEVGMKDNGKMTRNMEMGTVLIYRGIARRRNGTMVKLHDLTLYIIILFSFDIFFSCIINNYNIL